MTEKALADVTVLDFSHLLQGPFCTQLLADMGANVIKVERPGQGDLFRTMTFNNRWVGGSESPNFLAWNRNKRSIAVDLKAPEAKTILYRIAEKADVVVQNFRPGVLAKLGFGYEDFRKINPRIIYCSGSGYGESGPYLTRPGQDMLIQGLTGIAAATGRGDGPPVPVGAGFSDQVGAMNMVYGILSALYWRERSGTRPGDQGRPPHRHARPPGPGNADGDEFRHRLQAPQFRHRPSRHGGALRRLSDLRRLGDDRHEPLCPAGRRARRRQPARL